MFTKYVPQKSVIGWEVRKRNGSRMALVLPPGSTEWGTCPSRMWNT